ncbi:serine/threonine-protein kinase [Leptothoe sp. PORK10 BA2]|uniref:serine/threonine-protein kinase n=1 Tax=Leptothoe sp. PORK10 BA2 TaxID=3110254 RepID=UPI002B1EF08C|nr:serine/threonine-protein kinase [Leptothoe sp. PORK10 BA2]MEA5463117.1 serine/threonine-protein kinase [Leptothoe sp. PORK10 BA2]
MSRQQSNYRLLGLVGNGQFGRVYCGIHRKTGQLVAIKYLHRHSLPTHAFLRELHCLMSLAHPNIVACHAVEHGDAGRRLVLEYCVGGTLRSHMASPLSLPHILDLMSDVLCGLAHAHQQGIVHCDIKPENILLSYSDGRWRAKISDFGIAKLIQNQPHPKGLGQTGSGQTGSPAYMAPERFYCQYSPAADVYAVGIMLYELVVGQRPFQGTPTALQSAHLNQPIPEADQLIAPLKPIVAKALEKLPARRYATATEMLEQLRSLDPLSLVSPSIPRQQPITYYPYTEDPCHRLPEPGKQLKALAPAPGDQAGTAPQTLIAYGAQLALLQQQSFSYCQPVLDGPIQGLYPAKTGLIVSTEHSLWSGPSPDLLTPLTTWSTPSMVDIAPDHRWAAMVTPQSKQLTILRLNMARQADKHTAQPTGPSVHNSSSLKRPLCPDLDFKQVLVIDGGHLAIVGHTQKTGTQLQLWNRRGLYLTSLDLGITLGQLTPMGQPHHQSYQWMAVDVHAPQTVIFLTLKPLRLSRLRLNISPTIMLDLPWGYLFGNGAGRILLLDRDLHPIGGIQGPTGITAITPLSCHELLVATGHPGPTGGGAIHHLNLYEFDLDMIF